MTTPKKFTKEEAEKKSNERSIHIINGIACCIRLYLHSFEYFSILLDCYSCKYSEIRNSYIGANDYDKEKLLRQHFNTCDKVEIIERDTNKKGFYKISLQGTRDGNIKFLEGDDILDYKNIIENHNQFLCENKESYKNIDFNNYISLNKRNSERTTHDLEMENNRHLNVENLDLKEFLIIDEKLFNHIINDLKNKKFGIIREMESSTIAHIYRTCEVFSYDSDSKKILFNCIRCDNEIRIHKDLNINPFKDYEKFKRKQKISCLLK